MGQNESCGIAVRFFDAPLVNQLSYFKIKS
jgi:hypothetical protein